MTASAAVGIICKAPRPGVSKTRLATRIGQQAAAELSACFLRDVATCIEELPHDIGRKGYAVYAPAGAESELRQLFPPSFGFLLQSDIVLGNVLYGATRELIACGHDCAILVNGDSPTLPSRLLLDAIVRLRQPGDRLVLGPASDGGYYLIGLKHPHRQLFDDIPWGTNAVAERTLEQASLIKLETILLPEWYDVDDVMTFEWLRDELSGRSTRFTSGGAAPATRALVSKMTIASS